MKLADIKVGEEYVTEAGERVIPLDSKLWHRVYDGVRWTFGPGRYRGTIHYYTPDMGVPCASMASNGKWVPCVRTPQRIRGSWAEYAERKRQRRELELEAERQRQAERDRVAASRTRLHDLLLNAGCPGPQADRNRYTFGTFSDSEAMDWLSGVLEGQEPRIAASIQRGLLDASMEVQLAYTQKRDAEVARAAAEVARATAEARAQRLEEENKDLRFELDMDY